MYSKNDLAIRVIFYKGWIAEEKSFLSTKGEQCSDKLLKLEAELSSWLERSDKHAFTRI